MAVETQMPILSPVDTGACGSLWNQDNDSLPNLAFPALKSVAHLWPDIICADELELRPMKGAMTNKVFECHWARKEGEDARVIVRIYGDGTEVFFRREDEIAAFERMSTAGQGPKLLARFPSGRVEEFLHCRTLGKSDLRNSEMQQQIATAMNSFHRLPMAGLRESRLWARLRAWLDTALRIVPKAQVREFGLENLGSAVAALERRLGGPLERVGFCHNDLQYGNIMVDERTGAITLIDYEYSAYNAVAFDIANFFCEMAADYHTSTPHALDYALYPSYEERFRFVSAYLRPTACGDASPGHEEVAALVEGAEAYKILSHIHWGLWGLISGAVSDISFDYVEYARQRFQQYELLKPHALG